MERRQSPELARLFDIRSTPDMWALQARRILGEKIVAACRYRNVNIQLLAVQLGRSQHFFHTLRSSGNGAISRDVIAGVAELLGIDFEYLYDTSPGTLHDFYFALEGRRAKLGGTGYCDTRVDTYVPEMAFLRDIVPVK